MKAGLTSFPINRLKLIEETEPLSHNKIILRTDYPGYNLARTFIEKHCPNLECTSSSQLIADIIPRGINKGRGIALAAHVLGLDGENCCAFGDFENDLSMFQFCRLSFAMGNADIAVKNRATAVAPPHYADGVAQILERYFL